MKKQFLAAALVAISCSGLIGCAEDTTTTDPTSKATTVYSAKKPMGQDSVQTYYTTDDNGDPATIGIAFSSKAIMGLSTDPTNFMGNTFMIDMPAGMPAPWTFAMINWNPAGHEPLQIYGGPHFDFHFYTSSQTEVMGINMDGIPTPETTPIESKYLPSTSKTDGTIIPMMGVHWVDSTSPEFSGSPFTSTFIYGSYHQNLTFMEPMITKAYLDTKTNATFDVKQPSAWQKTGYYPTQYRITYDAGTDMYHIALVNLTKH